MNYIAKHSPQTETMEPHKKCSEEPKEQKVLTIFDWDDTLICTGFLQVGNDVKLTSRAQLSIKELEKASMKALSTAAKYGKVYIITNAIAGWVEYSTQKFMPKVWSVMNEHVTVVSARTMYEMNYMGTDYLL